MCEGHYISEYGFRPRFTDNVHQQSIDPNLILSVRRTLKENMLNINDIGYQIISLYRYDKLVSYQNKCTLRFNAINGILMN